MPADSTQTPPQLRLEVVILDRDGTLVTDPGYNTDPDKLVFLPGVADSVRALTAAGYRLVVVTNQSGVGRGYFTEAEVRSANARLVDMVAAAGGSLTAVYYCPHAPDARCTCRKPEVGLMLKAAQEHGFDPHLAVVIGDKESDVELAIRSGATSILLGDPEEAETKADRTVSSFAEAARLILGRTLWP